MAPPPPSGSVLPTKILDPPPLSQLTNLSCHGYDQVMVLLRNVGTRGTTLNVPSLVYLADVCKIQSS